MNILKCEQRSPEWWSFKVGKIGGTRFGKILSGRKNRLVYEIINERLNGFCSIDEYVSDDMQYGIDNENLALDLYKKETGISVNKIGCITSDTNESHIASPDGINDSYTIVQEVKCTMNGDVHLERFFEGIDSKYLPQCINYFAISEEIKQVHFISYCGYRPERPMFYIVLGREQYQEQIKSGIKKLSKVIEEVNQKMERYTF